MKEMRKTAESYVKIDPNVLYSAMQKQGITLSNLSRQCGHSRSYFSNIMLKCRVKREVAEKAEEILGVSIITTQNIEDRHPNRRRKITEEQKCK
ncbi:MAG TPA: hypothetical protein DDY31_01560 [Lachnospiraceae bacterium]|nr:hypothetical protein [Lachnospiraceae bacterium]